MTEFLQKNPDASGFAVAEPYGSKAIARVNSSGNRISVYHNIYDETSYDTEKEDECVIITPSGDITASGIDDFRSLLKRLTDQGYTRYRFDLLKVEEIDSVGLSAFIILSRMLSHQNAPADLEIINANGDIADLFRLAHMDASYQIG